MDKIKNELIKQIKEINDEKLLNNLKLIISGYIFNKK